MWVTTHQWIRIRPLCSKLFIFLITMHSTRGYIYVVPGCPELACWQISMLEAETGAWYPHHWSGVERDFGSVRWQEPTLMIVGQNGGDSRQIAILPQVDRAAIFCNFSMRWDKCLLRQNAKCLMLVQDHPDQLVQTHKLKGQHRSRLNDMLKSQNQFVVQRTRFVGGTVRYTQ